MAVEPVNDLVGRDEGWRLKAKDPLRALQLRVVKDRVFKLGLVLSVAAARNSKQEVRVLIG